LFKNQHDSERQKLRNESHLKSLASKKLVGWMFR